MRLKISKSSGGCCPCDEQTGCTCGTACRLECQSKTVIAELCGLDAYTSPSIPPKRYRREVVASNTAHRCNGGAWVTATASKTTQYDASTCGVTASGTVLAFCTVATRITTQTNITDTAIITQTATGVCCGSGDVIEENSTITRDLSDEDTEDDAIARENALIAWSPATPAENCCVADTGDCCCADHTAYKKQRGAGEFTLAARTCRTRARWTAVVGVTYDVVIHFSRRVEGSAGPFIDSGLIYGLNVTADVTNEQTDWIVVPNEDGWETKADYCTVTAVL